MAHNSDPESAAGAFPSKMTMSGIDNHARKNAAIVRPTVMMRNDRTQSQQTRKLTV